MKILTAVLLLMPAVAVAIKCPEGMIEWKGECSYDLKPYTADPVKPSDEKPPSDKMPSWQREGANVVDAPDMTADDVKADQDKTSAEAEGKQRAGIKPKLK